MCSALSAPPPSTGVGSLMATNLFRRRCRPSAALGDPGQLPVRQPHRQLVRRRELALDPIAELDVARAEDHVPVLLDPLEDLRGDVLGTDGALLEAGFELAESRAIGIHP